MLRFKVAELREALDKATELPTADSRDEERKF
jgi:hypothetical protein